MLVFIISLVLTLILALIKSWQVEPAHFSSYQLIQLKKVEDERFWRLESLGAALYLQAFLVALANGIFLAIVGLMKGVLTALSFALVANLVSDFLAQRVLRLDRFANKFQPQNWSTLKKDWVLWQRFLPVWRLQTSATTPDPIPQKLESEDELRAIIKQSQNLLDAPTRQFLLGGLAFPAQKVADQYQPLNKLITLETDQLLGPLVLDELSQSNQAFFPVVNNQKKILGLVNLSQIVQLDGSTTATVKQRMDTNFITVDPGQRLATAASLMLEQQQVVAAVVNKKGQFEGLLLIKDVWQIFFEGKSWYNLTNKNQEQEQNEQNSNS